MVITKRKLKNLKDGNKLKSYVINYVCNNYESDEMEGFFNDLAYGGCQSGMVGELIYYSDTVKFYKKFSNEIDVLLKEMFWSTGYNSPKELFGDKWDDEDPLARDTSNQNLLAWFGFEETAYQIANELGLND